MELKEYKYRINGIRFTVGVGDIQGNKVNVLVNGTPYVVEIDEENKPVNVSPVAPKPTAAPRTESGEKVIAKPTATAGGSYTVKSPLPGTIMSLSVKEGDTVNAGDTVCVLEAMKMENDVHTQKGGTVKKILVGVGDAVADGGDIMVIE